MKKLFFIISLLTISTLTLAQTQSVLVDCRPAWGPMGGSIVTLKGDLDLTDLDTGAKQAEGELMVIISDAMDGIILNQTAQFVGQYENIDGKASATVDTTINGVDVVAKINFSDKNLSRLEYKGRSHRMNCAK